MMLPDCPDLICLNSLFQIFQDNADMIIFYHDSSFLYYVNESMRAGLSIIIVVI